MTEALELGISEPYKDMLENMDEEDNEEITIKDQLGGGPRDELYDIK